MESTYFEACLVESESDLQNNFCEKVKFEAKPGDEVEAGGQEPHPNSLLQLCKKEKVPN